MQTPQDPPLTAEVALADSPAQGLWRKARVSREADQLAAAERYLERALAIDPNSSWLYRELADLRLAQGDAAGAEGLALRAQRLAPDNAAYRAGVWELIAVAREQQGKSAAAEQARARAKALYAPSLQAL